MFRFICSSLFVLTICASAQVPFAPMGAKWYENPWNEDITPAPHDVVIYEATGDTVVNQLKMRKVDPYLIYQDGQQVFFWDQDSNELRLIYDFGLTVGDSVTFEFQGSYSFGLQPRQGYITQDTMVMVDGVLLKKLICHIPENDTFVSADYHYMERVGVLPESDISAWSSVVPTDPRVDIIASGWPAFPRCYEDTGMLYRSPTFSSFGNIPCDYIQTVSISAPGSASDWRIFPNPTTGKLYIEGLEEGQHIRVIDGLGREVIDAYQDQPPMTEMTLPSAGFYVVQLLDRDGSLLAQQKILRY